MLSLEESSVFFQFLSSYSSAFIFPFEVDWRRGKLKKFCGWKFYLWLCVYSLAVIYYVQGLVRFLSHLMFRREEVVLLHLPMQFDAMVLPLVYHPTIIMIFCFNSDLFVKVFNEIYDNDSGEDNVSKPYRRFRQLPVQGQLVSGIGFITCGVTVFYGLMVVLLNDMSHLLINFEKLQFLKSSTISVLLTTLPEIWSFGMWLLKIGFLLSFNCLVLSKVESTLNKLLQDLRYVKVAK